MRTAFAVTSRREPTDVEVDPNLIAIVCDDVVDRVVPRFARDDVAAIAAFIVQRLGFER